jgi:cytochrome c-type biogenesis protein
VSDISYVAAFGGGLLSFISPCVLPLVPGYISYVSGVSLDQMRAGDAEERQRARRQMLRASLAFVLGLSLVFVIFGASASALGRLMISYKTTLAKIAGAVIIVLGLHMAGIFRLRWLDSDTRVQTKSQPAGLLGAFVVGVAFAFGWTPCIGPILGGILTIAASKNSVGEGVALLAVYSAGLGIPFLLTSLAIDRFFLASSRIRRHYKAIEMVAGVLLIALGALIFTNQFTLLSRYLDRWMPWLTKLS